MSVDPTRIGRVLGDRLLVKRVKPPERQRGLWVVRNSPLNAVKEQVVWWAEVVGLGSDARYPEAYGIRVSDVVGIVDVGGHSAGFEDSRGDSYSWVAEEFVCAVDEGRQDVLKRDTAWKGGDTLPGLRPVGPYVLVAPDPIAEKRGGVFLPQNTKSDTRTGRVLAVSPGFLSGDELHPILVVEGTEVLFGKYAGCAARFPDREFLLVKSGEGADSDLIAELLPEKETARA